MKEDDARPGGRGLVRRRALGLLVCAFLLVAGVVAVFEVTRATVTLQEEALSLEPGEIRTLHPRSPVGLPFRAALTWSVDPSWLGKMDERGGFHAGDVTGAGTLTTRFGPASAQIAVTVTCPESAEIQGIRFEVSCGRVADVYVDMSANGGPERAREEVEREADRVSRDLQIVSDRRFRVYYLGSTEKLGSAVSWLGRGFSSGPLVRESEAVYLDLADVIAIDQSQARLMDTAPVVRHELVHRSLRHLVGAANIDAVPTWLNEGWAFVEESGSAWVRAEARVVAASGAHLDRLPSLAALSDQGDWNRRGGVEGLYQYYVAAQATRFLIDDVTLPGLLRVLKVMGTGVTFAQALAQAVPGFDYDDFGRRFKGRVLALAPEYPAIIVAPGSPDEVGSTIIAYGLRPGAPATVTTVGPSERVFSGSVDVYGVYVKYLGAEWPVGQYRVTIETDGRRFEVTAAR